MSRDERPLENSREYDITSLSTMDTRGRTRAGEEEGHTFQNHQELSICRTRFESIYGISIIDTHSVCVQTDTDVKLVEGEKATSPVRESMTTTGECDAPWSNEDRAFWKEFKASSGTDVAQDEGKTSGNGSDGYKHPSKDIFSSTLSTANSTSAIGDTTRTAENGSKGSHKNVCPHEADQRLRCKPNEDDARKDEVANNSGTTSIRSTEIPKVAPMSLSIPATLAETPGALFSSSSSNEVPRVSPKTDKVHGTATFHVRNMNNLEAISKCANHADNVKQNTGMLRGQLSGTHGTNESTIWTLVEGDESDQNNRSNNYGKSKNPYGSRCSGCCQFCQGRSQFDSPMTPGKVKQNGKSLSQNTSANKREPQCLPNMPFNGADGINLESNCTSSCSMTCCLQPTQLDCCCCVACCSACQSRGDIHSSSSAGEPKSRDGPSADSPTICCSTTHHCRSTTTRTVGNNQVEQSTRSSCERTTSELIKSVRSDEDKHRTGDMCKQQVDGKEKDNNQPMNCPAGFQSIMEIGANFALNNVVNKGLPDMAADHKADLSKANTKDSMAVSTAAVKSDVKTKKVDAENDEEELVTSGEEGEMEKSTPDTVINNGERTRSGLDIVTSRSSGDNEAGPASVIEWARKKKRKVASKFRGEKQKIELGQIGKKKNINREAEVMTSGNNNSINGSWSVTVAGCYHPNMAAPDLQMRLSFPGTRSATQLQQPLPSSMAVMNWGEADMAPRLPPPVPELDFGQQQNVLDGEIEYNDQEDSLRQVLPVIDLVPKRKSLMRAPMDSCKGNMLCWGNRRVVISANHFGHLPLQIIPWPGSRTVAWQMV